MMRSARTINCKICDIEKTPRIVPGRSCVFVMAINPGRNRLMSCKFYNGFAASIGLYYRCYTYFILLCQNPG